MTPETFIQWLADMKSAGLARSDAAAGRLLGLTPNGIVKIKTRGADHRTALACAALLAGVKPYGSTIEETPT